MHLIENCRKRNAWKHNQKFQLVKWVYDKPDEFIPSVLSFIETIKKMNVQKLKEILWNFVLFKPFRLLNHQFERNGSKMFFEGLIGYGKYCMDYVLEIQKFSDFKQFFMMQVDLWILLRIRVLVFVMFFLDFLVIFCLVTWLDCSSVYLLKLLLQRYMHCPIVSHFNQQLQQNQLRSWIWLIWILNFWKQNSEKEKELIKMDKLWDNPFFLPKISKLHLSLLGVRSKVMESIGAVVMKNILSLKNYWKLKSSRICFSNFLFFKDGENDWRCSNYPFCHKKILHCAERKAFAHGTWTRCF